MAQSESEAVSTITLVEFKSAAMMATVKFCPSMETVCLEKPAPGGVLLITGCGGVGFIVGAGVAVGAGEGEGLTVGAGVTVGTGEGDVVEYGLTKGLKKASRRTAAAATITKIGAKPDWSKILMSRVGIIHYDQAPSTSFFT